MEQKWINIEEAANELATLLDSYEWFHSVEKENERVIVAYVLPEKCSKEAWNIIPDCLYGFQVKVWDYRYLECAKKYGLQKPIRRKLSGSAFDVFDG